MAKISINILRQYFRTGLKPSQGQFWDWFDSFWHKDEKIPLTALDGLQDELDLKADKTLVESLASNPIQSVTINETGNLLITMKSGEVVDCGVVKTPDGMFMTISEFVTAGGVGKVLAAFNADKLEGKTKAQLIEDLNALYAAIAHNHSYESLSGKPPIPSVSGLMVESEYAGETPTKSVASALQATHATKSDQDGSGNNIVDIYATKSALSDVEAIARGKERARVFDTLALLDAWLDIPDNVATLQVGDNFYIEALNVSDYWWNGTTKKELESKTVDLSDYYTKEQADAKYVAQVAGKALSTNDLTTFLKNAYDGVVAWISTNGQNILDHIADSSKHLTTALVTAWNAKWDSTSHPTTVAGYGITDISTNADTVDNFHVWSGSQAAYDAIVTKSSTTIYIIV
jgi:hypothetical protein